MIGVYGGALGRGTRELQGLLREAHFGPTTSCHWPLLASHCSSRISGTIYVPTQQLQSYSRATSQGQDCTLPSLCSSQCFITMHVLKCVLTFVSEILECTCVLEWSL